MIIAVNLALISDKRYQITQDESDLDESDPAGHVATLCTGAVWHVRLDRAVGEGGEGELDLYLVLEYAGYVFQFTIHCALRKYV